MHLCRESQCTIFDTALHRPPLMYAADGSNKNIINQSIERSDGDDAILLMSFLGCLLCQYFANSVLSTNLPSSLCLLFFMASAAGQISESS